ncbi:MAG: helix-turn-helix domain-containing protein [Leucobacter sp.]
MESHRSVGEALRTLRQQAEITQRDLATAADVSVAYLECIEQGRLQMSMGMVARLTRAITDELENCGGTK